jgi:hypothetical protein
MYVWLGMCTSYSSSWKGVVLDSIVQVRLGMCTSITLCDFWYRS